MLEKKSDLVLSGREIHHQSDSDSVATASVVFVWRVKGKRLFEWGVVTVGHLFWNRESVPETDSRVRVDFAGKDLSGQLLLRSLPDDGADIALVQVERTDLKDVLGFAPSTAARKIRSINDLKGDQGSRGASKPRQNAIRFHVLRYFPQFHSVPRIGTLFHILQVRSETAGTFKRGRSGSLWNIRRQVACHQIFGWETGGFREGGGQSMHHALRWLRAELAKIEGVPTEDLTIRIVHYL